MIVITDLDNINTKLSLFLKATMTNLIAANQNDNAIRFTHPDFSRDEKKDFPCLAFFTSLESSRENFGQLVDNVTYPNGSTDIIRVSAFIYAKFGVGTTIEFNSIKASGAKLLALVSSEFINAFKKSESVLQSKLSNSQIAEIPAFIDENVIVEGKDLTKNNPKVMYNELTAMIEVLDRWSN